MEEVEWDKCFFLFFLFILLPCWGKGEGRTLAVELHQLPGMGEWSLDDSLENLMWGKMFQGCYLNGFKGSET